MGLLILPRMIMSIIMNCFRTKGEVKALKIILLQLYGTLITHKFRVVILTSKPKAESTATAVLFFCRPLLVLLTTSYLCAIIATGKTVDAMGGQHPKYSQRIE